MKSFIRNTCKYYFTIVLECVIQICTISLVNAQKTEPKKKRKLFTFEPDPDVKAMLEKAKRAGLTDAQVRVSRAPDEVYRRYTAGFFGFKAALQPGVTRSRRVSS